MDYWYDCNNHVYQKKGGRISINPKKNLKREVTHIQIHHHYVGRPNKERIHKICFCDIGRVNCLFHRSLIDNRLFATLKITCLENAFHFKPPFYRISASAWLFKIPGPILTRDRAFGIHGYLSMYGIRYNSSK